MFESRGLKTIRSGELLDVGIDQLNDLLDMRCHLWEFVLTDSELFIFKLLMKKGEMNAIDIAKARKRSHKDTLLVLRSLKRKHYVTSRKMDYPKYSIQKGRRRELFKVREGLEF